MTFGGAALLCSAALLLVTACANSEAPLKNFEIKTILQHTQTREEWNVTYQTTTAVSGLIFTHQKNHFRSSTWQIESPDVHLVVLGDKEALISSSPRSEWRVRFNTYTNEVYDDYPFMTEFTDGGTSVYTGHLDVTTLQCQSTCTVSDVREQWAPSNEMTYQIFPGPGESIVVDDHISRLPIELKPGPQGTLIYFGQATPTVMGGYRLLVDEKLPKWIQYEIDQYLPQVLDLYRNSLGFDLPKAPIIFVPYIPGNTVTLSNAIGGVINQHLQIALYGSQWSKRTDKNREALLKLLFHEVFHFWNSFRFKTVDIPGGKWLHEGSADAMAHLALLDLGIVSQTRYQQLNSEALNRCLVGISGTSLALSKTRTELRNFYDCGMAFNLMAQASVEPADQPDNLFRFWRELFHQAESADRIYTHDMFFHLIEGQTWGKAAPAFIKQIVAQPLTSPDETFTEAFKGLGIKLETQTDAWPNWYHEVLSSKAIDSIMARDCRGSGVYAIADKMVQIVGDQNCDHLKSYYQAISIGGHSLLTAGVLAYDFIQETCQLSPSVALKTNQGEIEAACPNLPRRPAFLHF